MVTPNTPTDEFHPAKRLDVEFRAVTGTWKLRHPSYKGVRKDLDPTRL
jgi:hypothetical protein